ncbi:hypothetical protein ACFV2Q_35540 [Streptomyces sp. NPDC059650]|uniref:hypothetical protein n=1 Tax=Streptomyces sp. NPDC059650 TaxID=3346896 RepID=UPI003686DBA6
MRTDRPAAGDRKRRVRTGAAALAVLLAAPLLAGCSHSRQEVLDALHLELPDCDRVEHSYRDHQEFWPPDGVEISFTVPKDCMDGYLRAQGVDLEARPWSRWPREGDSYNGGGWIRATDPPFDKPTMKAFRLRLDASRVYPIHRFTTSYGSAFEVLLDDNGDGTTTAYLETAYPGPHVL